jgi:hypothetical protein
MQRSGRTVERDGMLGADELRERLLEFDCPGARRQPAGVENAEDGVALRLAEAGPVKGDRFVDGAQRTTSETAGCNRANVEASARRAAS